MIDPSPMQKAHAAARRIKRFKSKEGQRRAVLRWCQLMRAALTGR